MASAAAHLLHLLNLSSGKALTSLEGLLQQLCWHSIKREWNSDSWCGVHTSAKGRLRRELKMLKLASVLPKPICKRIEDCFSTLEVDLHQDLHTVNQMHSSQQKGAEQLALCGHGYRA